MPQVLEDGRLRLHWNASFDMDGEAVTYRCILARDAGFTDVIAKADSLRVPELICDAELEPGAYFVRLQATNESGWSQDCFDYYTGGDVVHGKQYGCFAFLVNEDGTFTAVVNTE